MTTASTRRDCGLRLKPSTTLGFVHVVAPLNQQTSTGHSMPIQSSGIIEQMTLHVNGRDWTVYAVDGSPGQAVLHGMFDVIKAKPDLLVSGINYGENVGVGITISGTVGAALEAASLGIPALAVSMQTGTEHHFSLSQDIDFNVAGYFTHKFAEIMLRAPLPEDVDVIKLDIPHGATPQTPMGTHPPIPQAILHSQTRQTRVSV
jgi:5'-nucleotidase